jgi:hypothetical protein
MQTFLAVPDFAESAKTLDLKRLDRQRTEALGILSTLLGTSSLGRDLSNHPAVVMWRGYEGELFRYGMTICKEYEARGYKDGVGLRLVELFTDALKHDRVKNRLSLKPYWLGVEGFHLSHRSNLLRMDPEHYRRFWPNDSDELDYVWPKFRPDVQGPWEPRGPLDHGTTRAHLAALAGARGSDEEVLADS